MLDYVLIIGFLAGALTTFSYLPQLIDAMKMKETRDLSETWLVASAVGSVLWIYYGYSIDSLPLTVFNSIGLVLVSALLALKLRYK